MTQFLAILVLLWICCSSAAAFVPSSLGGHKRQTHLCAVNDHALDRDDLNPQSSNDSNNHKLFHESSGTSLPRPDEQVYIILFKPDTQDEGVHTIEYPKGSGNNIILAFLSKHVCDTFANLLRKQEVWDPTTQEMNLQNLQEYCHSIIGVKVQVVPRGMKLIPPTERVETLSHDPTLRDSKNSLEYLMGIMSEEKDLGAVFNDNDCSWE